MLCIVDSSLSEKWRQCIVASCGSLTRRVFSYEELLIKLDLAEDAAGRSKVLSEASDIQCNDHYTPGIIAGVFDRKGKMHMFNIMGKEVDIRYLRKNMVFRSKELVTGCSKLEVPDCFKTLANVNIAPACRIDEVVVPDSVKSLHVNVFFRCSFKKVCLPSSLKLIPTGAFYECERLEEVEIPAGIERIERDAFLHCKSLKRVKIAGSAKDANIASTAFYGCSSLTYDGIEVYNADEATSEAVKHMIIGLT
jgi:hypothetical protein